MAVLSKTQFGILCLSGVLCVHFALGHLDNVRGKEVGSQQTRVNAKISEFEAKRLTKTDSGVLFDQSIMLEYRGVLFQIPAGYLPWGVGRSKVKINNPNYVFVSFWMPSKRWPEVNKFLIPDFRPKEQGRKYPNKDEYIVSVFLKTPFIDDDRAHVRPEHQINNVIKFKANGLIKDLPLDGFSNDIIGLIKFHDDSDKNSYEYYKHKPNSKIQLMLRCVKNVVNPLCEGNVHFIDEKLIIRIMFPRDYLPNWKDNAISARDLFESWRMK